MSEVSETYDVIVIGAGPSGYVAAVRCAQLGLKVACIDNWIGKNSKPSLGGTWINAGCVPALALLESARYYRSAKNDSSKHGVKISGVELDVPAMIRNKDLIIKKVSGQIEELFQANKINFLPGHAQLLAGKQVEIRPRSERAKKTKLLSAESIILAAGSNDQQVGTAPIDGDSIVDSNTAMNLQSVPKRLGIIGAGVIGVEHANIWARLGSKVTMLEAQSEFLSVTDHDIAAEALKQHQRIGIDIRLSARVLGAKKTARNVSVEYQDETGNQRLNLDKLIIAGGRKPNTDNLFAPEANLLLDERGFVDIDENCMTNLPGIYAIGDLVRGPMLAQKGTEQALYVADSIAGEEGELETFIIPNVIYTQPEIAWVGQTEQALQATGEHYDVGTFPFSASIRAQTMRKSEGFVKVIADTKTDRILGVHIIGNYASELIAEAVLAMEFSASSEDLVRTIHAHPTLCKSIHEAALDLDNRALHIPPRSIQD